MDPDNNNDAKEWDEVGLDFLSDRGVESDKDPKEQRTIDEQDEQRKSAEEEGAEEGDPAAKKQDEEPGASNDPEKGAGAEGEEGKPGEGEPAKPEDQQQPPAPDPDAEDRARRRAQLELDADRKELATEVREKLFSDKPTKLLDAEGREIRTPQDVTQYRNPRTGKNFTIEEASQWLMLAQRNLEENLEKDQKEIDRIVDVNLRIKEEADDVMREFGELLKANPKTKAKIWKDYQATLETNESGDVITNAPISMLNYYRNVLTPYKALAAQRAQERNAQAEADKKAAAQKAAKEKRQSQSDREDVFSTRTKGHEGMDPEEKEWADVAKNYYEG